MPHPETTVLRGRLQASLVLALIATAVAVATCTQDVGNDFTNRAVRAVKASANDALVGVDLGVATTAPLRQQALAGGRFTRNGTRDLVVAFAAFTTATPADDADGASTPLDRSASTPTDTNTADDVFLMAIVDSERVIAGQPVPTAFSQGIAPIMRDPRCTRCHSFHYPGGWRENGHVGNLPAATNAECDDCHKSGDVLVAGVSPSSIQWLAPDPNRTASPTFDFRGKTDRQLYDQLMALADPKAHMQGDDKIIWAIAHGHVPFRPNSNGGRVPMQPQHWQNLIEGWAQDGMRFSTDDDVDDVVLVSRRQAVNTAGNAGSDQPSVAFVANAGYDPANPTAQPLGTVYVAFASDATNLTATTTSTRNIFRAQFTAQLGSGGDVDLTYVGTVLVTPGTGAGANSDCDSPALDGTGNICAYVTAATNIAAGFVVDPTAARTNVWRMDITGGTRTLMSHAVGTTLTSGNGHSTAPVISADGGAIAYESDASNLIVSDANGVRDVFLARGTGTATVQRASQGTGGVEVLGGSSTHAALWVDPDTSVPWVAFESTADFGFGGSIPAVLLHQADSGVTLRVGSGTAALREPLLTPDGGKLVFLTDGAIDTARTDGNGLDDVMALDFRSFRSSATQTLTRASVSVIGADADGPSSAPAVGGFRQSDGTWLTDVLLAFTTTATNLGGSPNSSLVVDFAVDRTVERLVAEFTSTVTRGAIPFDMSFTDLSNNASAWSWDFGDGGTSTQQNPTHTYTTAGTYTVTLTVTGTATNVTETKAAFAQATPTAQSWATIFGTFAGTCAGSGCHNPGTGGGLFLNAGNAAQARSNLVNVASTTSGCAPLRVSPGDPDNSAFLQRVSSPPGCGSRMGNLNDQTLHDLFDWIRAGAP